jgi:hypothetical protein
MQESTASVFPLDLSRDRQRGITHEVLFILRQAGRPMLLCDITFGATTPQGPGRGRQGVGRSADGAAREISG